MRSAAAPRTSRCSTVACSRSGPRPSSSGSSGRAPRAGSPPAAASTRCSPLRVRSARPSWSTSWCGWGRCCGSSARTRPTSPSPARSSPSSPSWPSWRATRAWSARWPRCAPTARSASGTARTPSPTPPPRSRSSPTPPCPPPPRMRAGCPARSTAWCWCCIKLGVHELADGVSRQAIAVAAAHGTAMERLVHELNRIRLQLSWALRLERGGRLAAAATRFLGAAEIGARRGRALERRARPHPGGRPRLLDHPVGLRARPAQRRPPRGARRGGRHRALHRRPHRPRHRHGALPAGGPPPRRRGRRAAAPARRAGRRPVRARPGDLPAPRAVADRERHRPFGCAVALLRGAGGGAVGAARVAAHRAAQPLRAPPPRARARRRRRAGAAGPAHGAAQPPRARPAAPRDQHLRRAASRARSP